VLRERRPSSQTIRVLQALAPEPLRWRYGYELGREVGLRSGSLYPILVRLSDRELLEAAWETDATPGRPPRHLYRLTARGREYAAIHVKYPLPAARALQRTALRSAS
jgi:PadR family transcriptional regulator PadR